jgi:hypothetical protein
MKHDSDVAMKLSELLQGIDGVRQFLFVGEKNAT